MKISVLQNTILALLIVLTCSLFTSLRTAVAADVQPKWAQDFAKACDRNSLQECLNLAVAYSRGEHNGKKINKDPALAKSYTDRSMELGTVGCKQGNLKACYTLALLYFEGALIETDFSKSIEYGNKACAGGLKEACEWLRNSGL
ncbi:MAG: sel1 repeat family protein [Gammaproteobacteria bacterium]|nr:sel1 repeat family protein [Gammaproteobacteria bacterium]